MKRYWILTLIGLVLCLGVAWAMKSMPRLLSDEECSLIYQRYADDPGIEASFVKGFRVNDTLAIDATLLHATDSASWERLKEELRLPAPTPIVTKSIEKGTDAIILYMTRKGSVARDMDMEDLDNNDVVGLSYMNHTVCIYHINNGEERKAVLHYNTEISTKH